MKPTFAKILLFLLLLLASSNQLLAQCPDVINAQQSFCDTESATISSLTATDNGGGVLWFSSANATTPLTPSTPLVNGATYFAGDSSNSCQNRQSVSVTIYGAPTGLNFQGVCVENIADATLLQLTVLGNDIKWYTTPFGGIPLDPTTQLENNTIYFASQTNPHTGCESSRLAVFVNVRVVTAPSGEATQTFCYDSSTETKTVADLVVDVPMYNWYLSENSVVPLASNAPLIDGHTYYATSLSVPCESTGRFAVTVHLYEENNAGESTNVTYCQVDLNEVNSVVNLFELLAGNPQNTGTWQGDIAIGNGNLGTINLLDLEIDTLYSFTYTVTTTAECEVSQAVVQIRIVPPLNAGISNQLEVCPTDTADYDLFQLLGVNADLGGHWVPQLASGTNIFNPQLDSIGVYTYVFDDNCNKNTSTITISLLPELNPGEDNNLEICENDTTTYDLFMLLGNNADQGGIWTPALASGTNIFEPQIDQAGVYTYSFADTCSESASITVTFIPVLHPGQDNTLEICENDSNTVDLFALLGNNADPSGFWTPLLASGTGIFNPEVDLAGVYTYSFNDNCSDSASVAVSFISDLNPGENALLEICESDINTYDLFNLLGGNPDLGGIWTPQLTSGTNIFDPQLDAAGVYTYSFNDNCSESSSVTITVLPELNPGENTTLDVCENDTTNYNLFSLLGENAQSGGFWTPELSSGTNTFNPQVDSEGVYTYSFGDNCSGSATVTVTFTPVFNPGVSNSLVICDYVTANINLLSLLGENAQEGGFWTPSLASGTNIFNPQIDPAGDYTYSFNNNCSGSATVEIVIIAESNPGVSNTIEICAADTNPVDLFSLLGNDADQGGSWTPSLASGTNIFDPQLDPAGVYTYSFGDICSGTATITVNHIEPINAGDDNAVEICQGDTSTVDLFQYLGNDAQQGGFWTPSLASGTSVFNPQIDAIGVYTYSFTEACSTSASITVVFSPVLNPGENNSIEICENEVTTIDLFTLLGNNAEQGGSWTPQLASGTSIFDPQLDAIGVYTYSFNDLCSDSATITITHTPSLYAGEDNIIEICPDSTDFYDMFTFLGENADQGGTWSPPLASGGGIFNLQLDAVTTYTYSFSDTCADSATITIVLLSEQNAGEDNTLEICENDTNTYDLFELLGENAEPGGTWSPALASGTSIYDPQLDVVGSYTYSFADTCSNSATITISEVPELNAGEDATLEICENETNTYDLFSLLGGNPDLGGIWTPALASGTNIFDPQLDVAESYMYSFDDDCNFSYSSITIERKICDTPIDELLIPDGFSPNGDGINDTFEIRNIRTLYPNFKIEIYNRYGNLLFVGNSNTPDWDGTTQKGVQISEGKSPVGVYFYILYFNDGQRSSKQGRLYLSR